MPPRAIVYQGFHAARLIAELQLLLQVCLGSPSVRRKCGQGHYLHPVFILPPRPQLIARTPAS
jgi:hypothetical protein